MANGDMWTLQVVTTESNMNYLHPESSRKVPVAIIVVSCVVAILLIIGNRFTFTTI